MPILTPYRLTFAGGLHLGVRGVNLEEARVHLPSDTIFAALVDAWRRTGGDAAAFARPFVGESAAPPFLLSSGFPFAGGVRFYPIPVDLKRLFGRAMIEDRGKQIKRVRYLSEGLLRKALAGEALDDWMFPKDEYAQPGLGVALQGGSLWLMYEEIGELPSFMRPGRDRLHALRRQQVYGSGRVPRVTVDRGASASTIFHVGRTSFARGCGLWFGVAWQGQADGGIEYGSALELALGLLQHDGLGGERTTGYGAFTWERGGEFSLPDATPGGPAWLLSRYHPRNSELPRVLADGQAAYRLTSVGGWLRSPDGAARRRKRLYLLEEGSIICPQDYPAGDVVNLNPTYENPSGDLPHPVYRYGLALAVGMEEAAHG